MCGEGGGKVIKGQTLACERYGGGRISLYQGLGECDMNGDICDENDSWL